MRHFLIWMMMLAAAAGPAAGAFPQELELARKSCEQGKFLEAIRMFDRILNARAGTDAAAEADEALDRCVKKVAQSNEADNLLGEISREYAGRAAGAKALGRLAADQLHREEGDCRAPSPFYRDLLDQYGKTREAARVIISRASRCLGKREHEREALADLEGVADAQKGNPEGALALWMIGNYYRDQEDRDRAAIYYHRAIDEYPETLEYPYHPGLKVIKFARIDLELLRTYYFSPLLDRLMKRIDRTLLQGVLGMDPLRTSFLALALVPYTVALGALGLALLLVPALRRRGSAGKDPDLLVRPWSLWAAAALLGGFCTLTFLLSVLSWLCLEKGHSSVWSFLDVYHGSELLLSSAVLVLVLRTEPLSRVFRIDRKRPLRLALVIPAGIVGFALLGAILMLPLWWLGLVKLGPDVNRFLSTETSLRFDSWGWRVPLVILGATAEEVLFRGVLHDALRRRVPTLAAAVLGSFVFAAVHTRPLDFSVGPFAIGLILVLLREKFRSLTPPAVCHCLWNFMILSFR